MSKILYVDQKPALSDSAKEKLTGFESKTLKENVSEGTLISEIKNAHYVVSGSRYISKEYIKEADNLKAILLPCAGYDHVDIEAASEENIYVVNAPGANSIAVAEMAFGLMLSLARNIVQSNNGLKKGKWNDSSFRDKYGGLELTNKILGIVGLGNVGKKVAEIAQGFDMDIICYTKNPSSERAEKYGVTFVDLEELMKTANFITICVALTPATKNLIGREEIKLIKNDSYLINVARGKIVNYEELYNALLNNEIGGAGLDVFHKEPPNSDNPLYDLDNVVLTPHLGSRSREAINRTSHIIADEIIRIDSGEVPENLININVI